MLIKRLLLVLAGIIALVSLAANIGFPSFGGDVTGIRYERVRLSLHQVEGKFRNTVVQSTAEIGDYWNYVVEQATGDQIRTPVGAIPVIPVDTEKFKTKAEEGLRAIWLGHASVYIELDGYRLLVDPVLSDYASPVDGIGPKRFHSSPIKIQDLPNIDAVMISHDHYDHLDMKTVQYLARNGSVFYVPLGIGAHLDEWNVPQKQIIELDWWEKAAMGNLKIVSTPARHYSGRELFDYKETFWSSWSVIGPKHRLFYSGDTGYSDHFKEIGSKLGPFDLGIIKVGAYGPGDSWIDIHMEPEQAVQSFVDIKGKRMLPVHWATFNMAFHHWKEPIRRALVAAEKLDVELVTPRIGEIVSSSEHFVSLPWWESVK